MDNSELVRSWKEPKERDGKPAGHPVGDMMLRVGAMLGQRTGLLAGVAVVGLAIVAVAGDCFPTNSTTIQP